MFRRKSVAADQVDPEGQKGPGSAATDAGATPDAADEQPRGPFDAADLSDATGRVDVGALLLLPVPDREIRLQVVEKTGEVASVLIVGAEGAMELQAFAAPRNGDLWTQVRPQIVADVERRGGRTSEREGPFGVELMCQVPVTVQDGETGVQPSRIIGVNGPRWLLRATLLGRPAIDLAVGKEWEDVLAQVAVRRGDHAMPVGRPLPLTLPDDARKAT